MTKYSDERNAQVIISLLKQHGVRYAVVSPGNTNYPIAGSLQYDSFFTVYSSVDERSAAYLACGIAETTGEAVVISCTGATASRNYLPGLTEAYYRKLPIIAVTSFNGTQQIGQLLPQNIDRSVIQNDVARISVDVPIIKDEDDARYVNRIVNTAILETKRHGGGPVHINVSTNYTNTFSEGLLPESRCITRFVHGDNLPDLPSDAKIAVVIGTHVPFDERTSKAIDRFARSHDAVVLCNLISNYHGFGAVHATLATDGFGLLHPEFKIHKPDLIIHIGEVWGDYPIEAFAIKAGAPVWRVSPDGELKDRFGSLRYVFEMPEFEFFSRYDGEECSDHPFLDLWSSREDKIEKLVPELPFSNRWIARRLCKGLPNGSLLHLAILNCMRSWGGLKPHSSIRCFSNTGGFGIDGCLSAAIGSALVSNGQPCYLIIGDLAFFYDMNSLGNRSLPSNMRILLVNNGVGGEFHMHYSPAAVMGDDVDEFVAAAGHFVPQYPTDNVKTPAQAWAESLGLRYLYSNDKQSFEAELGTFVSDDALSTPILFECTVDIKDEEEAARILGSLDKTSSDIEKIKEIAKKALPKTAVEAIKNIIK